MEPELARVRQGGELPVEGELPLIEGAVEQRQELAPEQSRRSLGHAPSTEIDSWNGTPGAILVTLYQGYPRFLASGLGHKRTDSTTGWKQGRGWKQGHS